jgi:hypothetical protein
VLVKTLRSISLCLSNSRSKRQTLTDRLPYNLSNCIFLHH